MLYNGTIQIDLKPRLRFDGYVLAHTGKGKAKSEKSVPEHFHHTLYEVTAFIAGKGKCYTGNTATEVKKGDIYVSFPFENHRITPDPDEMLEFVFVSFEVTDPAFSNRLKRLWSNTVPPENRIFHNEMAVYLINSLIVELAHGKEKYFSELAPAVLEQLVIYILRGFSDRIPESLSQTPTEEELCRYAAHYIDTHLLSMKQLKECAEAMSYNYCYLTTIFKANTGVTLSEYYRNKRLEMAKLLIEENNMSLSEVAEALNYSGISAFSKAFKTGFGISPREYAKKCQTE